MNRRKFLGWLGATSSAVAVYSQVELPPSSSLILPEELERAVAKVPAAFYVVKNQSEQPMVVHYRRNGGDLHVERGKHAVHVSTVLLPGEELTITAVPVKL